MQSYVFSSTQQASCVHLPDSVAVYVLHGFHTCLHVLLMTANGDVCAAEGPKDLKERKNYVC
jgi:hypothetical protein